jgi:hypothetical protein
MSLLSFGVLYVLAKKGQEEWPHSRSPGAPKLRPLPGSRRPGIDARAERSLFYGQHTSPTSTPNPVPLAKVPVAVNLPLAPS